MYAIQALEILYISPFISSEVYSLPGVSLLSETSTGRGDQAA